MKMLTAMICAVMFYMVTSVLASTPTQNGRCVTKNPAETAKAIGVATYRQITPALLPDGNYLTPASEPVLVFKKEGVVVTGLSYSHETPKKYCFWGMIGPDGELFAEKRIINDSHPLNLEIISEGDEINTDDTEDDEQEISVALNDIVIAPWEQGKYREIPSANARQQVLVMFNECTMLFKKFK